MVDLGSVPHSGPHSFCLKAYEAFGWVHSGPGDVLGCGGCERIVGLHTPFVGFALGYSAGSVLDKSLG